MMTAKKELLGLGLKPRWADRLTNHEAESVLSTVEAEASTHDAAHGNGAFKTDRALCAKAAFHATLDKLTHRGIPADRI